MEMWPETREAVSGHSAFVEGAQLLKQQKNGLLSKAQCAEGKKSSHLAIVVVY